MAAKKPSDALAPAAVQAAPVEKASPVERDLWKVMVEVHPERGDRSEPATIFVSLNNRNFYIPKGKTSQVPYPIYLRLQQLQKAQVAEEKLWKEMQGQNIDLTR